MKISSLLLILCLPVFFLYGQAEPEPDTVPARNEASPPANPKKPTLTSQEKTSEDSSDLPVFDPTTEIVQWNGQSFSVTDNRLLRSRFEKYLNLAEEDDADSIEYRKLMKEIFTKLAPGNDPIASTDEAFQLLKRASTYSVDNDLCDTLADAVYAVWLSRNENKRIDLANEGLEKQLSKEEWRLKDKAKPMDTSRYSPPKGAGAEQWAEDMKEEREARLEPHKRRKTETIANLGLNKVAQTERKLQAKLMFQSLVFQMFVQRRFDHVLIGTRLYRRLFNDGDGKLYGDGEAQTSFQSNTGLPSTVDGLEFLAKSAVKEAQEGVEAYLYLLGKNEMESATKRLQEAFLIGEYVPELRTLPREDKRKALEFVRKSNQLISAIDMKDFALAEKLVGEISEIAQDFDTSKPLAAIETSKAVSAMHLAKAKNAAIGGDAKTLEEELRKAMELWPRNPALAEVQGSIISQTDVQQKALADLDQLLSQKNYRQVYDDRMRYIAAVAMFPERQERLKQAMDAMQAIEAAIMQSNEMVKHGDFAGAWETLERTYKNYPDDNKLNQLRADMTTRAANFVHTLQTAEEKEKQGQTGSSLAWFLKAKQMYPGSQFAQEGIDRLVGQILPEENENTTDSE